MYHRTFSVGEEYELLLALFIQADNSADLVWILLHRQLSGHIAYSIRLDTWFRRKTALPLHRFEVIVGLSTDDKVGFNALNVMKTFEVVVTSVEDVEWVLFIRNDIHCFCVVDICWCYVKECGYLCFKIIQGVHLDSSFPFLNRAHSKVLRHQACEIHFEGIINFIPDLSLFPVLAGNRQGSIPDMHLITAIP